MINNRKQISLLLLLAAFAVTFFSVASAVASEQPEPEKAPEVKSEKKYEVSLEVGRATYQHYCTPCHGIKGDGNGFNAPTLLVKPANHTDSKFMSERNDTKLFDAINLGGAEVAKSTLMPPWGAALGDERIKSLVLYLRELCNCQAAKKW
ncbi:MAG: cytochrome c [Thermodesulfobacteriota bacterium]